MECIFIILFICSVKEAFLFQVHQERQNPALEKQDDSKFLKLLFYGCNESNTICNQQPDSQGKPDLSDDPEGPDRVERPNDLDRLSQPDKPEIPDQPDQPEKPEIPDLPDHQPYKPEISDRPDKPNLIGLLFKPSGLDQPDIPDLADKSVRPIRPLKPKRPVRPKHPHALSRPVMDLLSLPYRPNQQELPSLLDRA